MLRLTLRHQRRRLTMITTFLPLFFNKCCGSSIRKLTELKGPARLKANMSTPSGRVGHEPFFVPSPFCCASFRCASFPTVAVAVAVAVSITSLCSRPAGHSLSFTSRSLRPEGVIRSAAPRSHAHHTTIRRPSAMVSSLLVLRIIFPHSPFRALRIFDHAHSLRSHSSTTALTDITSPLQALGFCLLLPLLVTGQHAFEGIKNIIQDYVHNQKTEMLTILFLECFQIELLKHTLV
jgi:succinate dehydrogenase hydrophobic anchor subunit